MDLSRLWRQGPQRPAAEGGSHYMADLNMQADFKIVEAASGSPEDDEEEVAAAGGKKRVVWNTDLDRVQEYFLEHRDPLPPSSVIGGRPDTLLERPVATPEKEAHGSVRMLQARETSRPSPSSDQGRLRTPLWPPSQAEGAAAAAHRPAVDLRGKVACYREGMTVEHLSTSEGQAKWVTSPIHVTLSQSQKDGHSLCYTVMEGRGDERSEVQAKLEELRLPFAPGEAVQVFSYRNDGEWIPGRISRGARATQGYEISVTSADSPGGHGFKIAGVPSYRLRRRFPAFAEVSVYYDDVVGWKTHRVHPAAGQDGSLARSMTTPFFRDASEATIEMCTLVPLCGAKGDYREVEKWVESYRVRRWNATETLCM